MKPSPPGAGASDGLTACDGTEAAVGISRIPVM